MAGNSRWAPRTLYALFAAGAFLLCLIKPFHNWDMIGYIASAKAFEERDAAALHTFAYGQLRTVVTPHEYLVLTGASGTTGQDQAQRIAATTPEAFAQQLPFYRIRPLYTGMVYLLYKAGVNIGFATHLISGLAIIAAVGVIYGLAIAHLYRMHVYGLLLLAAACGVVDLARLSTPDGLAFLAVVGAAFLFVTGRIAWLLLLLPVMIAIRTDLILLVLPWLAGLLFTDRRYWPGIALSALAAIALMAGINWYASNPGWQTTFYCTLVHSQPYPLSTPPTLAAADYWTAVRKGAGALTANKVFLLYILIAAWMAGKVMVQARRTSLWSAINRPPVILAIVCGIFVATHFMLFPVAWDRFFASAYMLTAWACFRLQHEAPACSGKPPGTDPVLPVATPE